MIKRLIKRIALREKYSSERFVKYLRDCGMLIGDNVRFYSPKNTLVDMQAPWLVSIGNNVSITHGVIILTHDYSWSVLKRKSSKKGIILGAQSPVKIGSNVFIGMNSVITRGVEIGDNVIIGAGSVVTHNCESDAVYAGNPAKKIMTLEEFFSKREKAQLEEAKAMALLYRERFNQEPPREVFSEYFMLFSNYDTAVENKSFLSQLKTGDNFEESLSFMKSTSPMFESYEAFLKECYKE